MTKSSFLALATLVAAAPQVAGAQERIASVARAMPSRYIDPTCNLRPGHFLVSSGVTYLAVGSGGNRNIDGTTDPEKIETQLNKAVEVLSEAITQRGQAQNGAAWYYLGRAYLQSGDIIGADSAFTKAQSLEPACGDDIKQWRTRAYLPLATPAANHANSGNADSAMILFRRAGIIARDMPQAPYNIGVLYANAGQADSAITYFKAAQAAAAASDAYTRDRNAATFNLAAMYQRSNQHALAVAELRRYVEWEPADADARRALATSLRATGQAAEAAEVERQLVAAAQAAGTLSTNDLMQLGVNAFNDKKFDEAADAFTRILALDSLNRDAQFNLANTYLATQDGPKLVVAAGPLLAREPLSEDNHKFLAQGYRYANNQDKLIEVVTELLAMPTAITIERFAPQPGKATLAGFAIGRQAETSSGARLPAAGRGITVEFLDVHGAVVASKELEIPALEPAVKFEWAVEAEGAGIHAWRYKVRP